MSVADDHDCVFELAQSLSWCGCVILTVHFMCAHKVHCCFPKCNSCALEYTGHCVSCALCCRVVGANFYYSQVSEHPSCSLCTPGSLPPTDQMFWSSPSMGSSRPALI